MKKFTEAKVLLILTLNAYTNDKKQQISIDVSLLGVIIFSAFKS